MSSKISRYNTNITCSLLNSNMKASNRSAFMLELRRELGDRFEHFQSLDSFEKSSYDR